MEVLHLLHGFTGAQPPPTSPSSHHNYKGFSTADFNLSITIIMVVLIIAAFFFLAFSLIYIHRCYFGHHAASGPVRIFAEGGAVVPLRYRGLNSAALEMFPIFAYSEAVSGLEKGKRPLDCAICLSEFSHDEALRLLPSCNHVFHLECIDVWLDCHVTCPVCRINLENDNPLPRPQEAIADRRCVGIEMTGLPGTTGIKQEVAGPVRFARSHTTGHLVVRTEGDRERYTLRLREHAGEEFIEASKLRRAASYVGFPSVGKGAIGVGIELGDLRNGRSH